MVVQIESLKRFCRAIVEEFGGKYLRSPNAIDVTRLLYIGKDRGFPRMLGSLECIRWKWKNCPTEWAGQYVGCSGCPTIILEVVADYDLWICHAYFGLSGPTRFLHKHVLHDIMTTCIIMHNMIIADERDVDASIEDRMEAPTPEVEMVLDENTRFQQFLARHRGIRDKDTHIAL
ncbi:hypothetical protein Ddye_003317 [Dipteronia dyeriana]|uniref:Uncharacterized protein n=1 Tax=Dipteronia dyeriana TaxID=168575 RepID=A0AAD9XSS2_9ROSI|nr:hypothetical protein Ddye_003317 [Dipteronia dyeriana]